MFALYLFPCIGILEELQRVKAGDMFGSVLDINAIGAGVLPPDTMIPGVAVASTRATPLAGRLNT